MSFWQTWRAAARLKREIALMQDEDLRVMRAFWDKMDDANGRPS